ncbi:T9SS type A sorting domain-containing protein [Dyadobacter flavalbus]|uniref:T9SS type A sorting domain-containing protein n=1 Tax=Dyadobacter flavalbus TaxID=2579942 RepID=A0A5M8Q9D6_9BACT|nr:T9SS type A sorting domain-containing protein [Dyadobacter flavalbus]KAA6431450.1 T9SS type A sorting domain-containing protein [Dyadobacter flavalbus]
MKKLCIPAMRFDQYALIINLLMLLSPAYSLAVPVAPASLKATAVSPVQINLEWTDASLDETGFEVERSPDGKIFVRIADLPANSKVFQNLQLVASTTYWYRVRAKNASGFSAYSNIVSAVTKPPVITIPKAPANLAVTTVTGKEINLKWTDNATDETGFELERSLNGTAFIKIADIAANATAYADTGLASTTKYWYRLLAKNTAGKSAYSNVVSATTLEVVPNAPAGLIATAVSPFQINLAWTDKAVNETGFQLERSLDGVTFTKIADIAANRIVYENTGLAPATKYYYRIRAVNLIGASAYSAVSSATTQQIPVPDRPLNFTAVPLAPDLIQLNWSPVTGNADAIIVERSQNTDGNFREIGRLPASAVQYQDTDSLAITDYYYRIKAVNAGGSSPYSLISIVRGSTIITANEPLTNQNRIYAYGRTLVIDLKPQPQCRLSIYDLKGILRNQQSVQPSSQVDLGSLHPGIYIVVVETENTLLKHKIAID